MCRASGDRDARARSHAEGGGRECDRGGRLTQQFPRGTTVNVLSIRASGERRGALNRDRSDRPYGISPAPDGLVRAAIIHFVS